MVQSESGVYLINAFSVNQLATFPVRVHIEHLNIHEAKGLVDKGFSSAVGHADTAALFSDQLGVTVTCNRCSISLRPGDRALLGQYRGARLPLGASSLPTGCTIEWFLIRISSDMRER